MANEKIVFGEIRVKRGLKANLPILNPGEPAFCTDTGEYFIGTEDGANMLLNSGGTGGGSIPSNVILFEDWNAGESVIIDTGNTTPPADTTAPILTITSGGTFTGTKSITMSTNETSNIYYTIDGSTPTTNSSKYTAQLNISSTTTIKAFAVDTAGNQSSIQTITYTLDTSGQTPSDTTPPVLTITPASTFTDSQTVTMSVNETADIWYTTDGSDPVSSGTRIKYSTTLTLSSTTTVKAYAVDTTGNASAVQTVTYTLSQSFSRLQMDGIDDKITIPSIAFDKVEFDGLFDSSQDVLRYILQNVTGGTTVLARIDNTDKIAMGSGMTQSGFILDSRTILTLTLTSVATTGLQIFARGDGVGSFAKGEIYSIKFYNGANLTAHYNMATGTVQDQSGNGKHATLTGGTWI